MTQSFHPPAWHALSEIESLRILDVEPGFGLSHQEAELRLMQYGSNSLPSVRRRRLWLRFATQFNNPLIYILLITGGITLFLNDFVDSAVILGVVFINALIGFIQEGKAEQALEAVSALLATRATVLREGERHEIDAARLVPGDIVFLESGTRVPADLRLLQVHNLRINEAALTGESLPVGKHTELVAEDAQIGDRICMAYSGSVVGTGQARSLVVSTGSNTEMGHIGTLVRTVHVLATPLTLRLDQFARVITLFILAASVVVFLYGYFIREMPVLAIFLAVVGFTVAAIPEGLPAIVTIVLSIGTRIMARNHLLVRRLPAVEALGSVSVICTDKTGTLTKNEMTAVHVLLPGRTLAVSGAGYAPEGGFYLDDVAVDPAQERELLDLAQCALLCNDAQLKHDTTNGWVLVGDPTEGALLTLAQKSGLNPVEVAKANPRLDEIPFESEYRFMATLHHDHEGRGFILLKGAPEQVMALCVRDSLGAPVNHSVWVARIEAVARSGQRVLALARCDMPANTTTLSLSDITRRFILLGMTGLIDPPRDEAITAVAECQQAGLRVKMITGDHAITARAIGYQLGLNSKQVLTGEDIDKLDDSSLQIQAMETDIFARANPEHKLRLVTALQARGALVAMTGDGVNDAPALRAANIGVAMGQKGTDVAREAADLVLTDDNFATITQAVREGRVVFDNIKKSLLFILPTNGGEAGVILLALFAGMALPVTAGQILWVNMVTTVTLALSMAFEPGEAGIMRRPPRKASEPLITGPLAGRIAYVSLMMIVTTFTVFEWSLSRGQSVEMARTVAVNMLVVGEIFYLFNARNFTASSINWAIFTRNPVALLMTGILIGLQLLLTYTVPMQQIFHTRALDGISWMMIVVLGLGLFLAVEAEKAVLRHLHVHHV